MSDNILETDTIIVTSYYGGDVRGRCIDILDRFTSVRVTLIASDAEKLVNVLHGWLDGSIP